VDLTLLSGEPVDIVMQPTIQEHYLRAYKNIFEPLDDYMKTEGIKYEDLYSFSAQVNGKVYGLPGDAKIWFVIINKRLLEAAGLPLPKLDWTWDDYREYSKKLTKGTGENKQYGSYMHTWDTYANLGLYSTKIGTPYWKDSDTHNLDDPNLRDWMQFKYDMENLDKSQMKFFEEKEGNVSYRDMFYKEKVAMLPIGTWMLGEMTDASKYPHSFVTTFAPLPRWKNSPEGRTVADCHFYCINKNSLNKNEAYEFLRFYTTEGQNIKAINLSAQKGAENAEIVDTIIRGNEGMFDVPALNAVLYNPKRFDNVFDIVPDTDKAIKFIFLEEYEKFMIGGQSIDTTMMNMKKRADEAVEALKQ
jgi:multiple sugar transport system substrate-binding protein